MQISLHTIKNNATTALLAKLAKNSILLGLFTTSLLLTSCKRTLSDPEIQLAPPSNAEPVTDAYQATEEFILFLGNSGVGKTHLCNIIFQEDLFKQADLLPSFKQVQPYQGKLYVEDLVMERKHYIAKDLSSNPPINAVVQRMAEVFTPVRKSNNKLIFVVNLASDEMVAAEDLLLINTVCDLIKSSFEYGLIINRVSQPMLEKIDQKNMENYLSSLKKMPTHLTLVQEDIRSNATSQNRENLVDLVGSLEVNKPIRVKYSKLWKILPGLNKNLEEIREKQKSQLPAITKSPLAECQEPLEREELEKCSPILNNTINNQTGPSTPPTANQTNHM